MYDNCCHRTRLVLKTFFGSGSDPTKEMSLGLGGSLDSPTRETIVLVWVPRGVLVRYRGVQNSNKNPTEPKDIKKIH